MSIIEKAVDKLDQQMHDRSHLSDDVQSRRPGDEPVREMTSGAAASVFETPGVQANKTGFKPISRKARVDLEKLSKRGLITPDKADTLIGEQCRYIKRPLLVKAAKNGGRDNLIMVSSALPGEGKTFTAINLAMSIAMEVDRSVCLVDADVMKSDIGNYLNFKPARGLTDLLSEPKLQLSDILMKTNVSSLDLLASGKFRHHLTELFASARMKDLVTELSQRYDIVVFDSMPVLAKSGASVLAALVGQIVFVVEAVKTSRRTVREALNLLDSESSIGLVLNKSRERISRKYGYDYYYGHARW